MNGLNNSTDDVVECPLCMEPLDYDDINFYPCTCGYQICRFCWHRIRTDENKLCPACRKEYPENPADFTPLTQEQMIKYKSQKRQRDQQRKQKITENRKHLANVRVVQKNLVFVVGLPPRLADADILKKHEYFGKFGKIHKVVINPSTAYAGVQGPSASAYVTYVNNSDALRAIQSVNNITIDGRLIKTSLGTTKYCSHFMKNQQCPKGDCMYLHELGDTEASFTKEEMHQGKHQEYEKRLHDALIATSGSSGNNSIGNTATNSGVGGSSPSAGSGSMSHNSNPNKTSSGTPVLSSTTSSSAGLSGITSGSSIAIATGQQKDAWPSLSVSPVSNKDALNGNNSKNKKDKVKHEKSKSEKNAKSKSKNVSHSANIISKEQSSGVKDYSADLTTGLGIESNGNGVSNGSSITNNKPKSEKNKERINHDKVSTRNIRDQLQKDKRAISADEEVKQIEDAEQHDNNSNHKINRSNTASNNEQNITHSLKSDEQRSLSSSSISSNSSTSRYSKSSDHSTSMISESISGKSSPGSFPGCTLTETGVKCTTTANVSDDSEDTNKKLISIENHDEDGESITNIGNNDTNISIIADDNKKYEDTSSASLSEKVSNDIPLLSSSNSGILETAAALSKLNFFDDNNSFFSSSSTASLQQSLLLKNKHIADLRQNPMNNNIITSQLPDLLNGIDEYQNNTVNTNEWEDTFKIVRNTKQIEEQLQQQQQFHHHQLQQQQQEEFLRLQELQKRKSFLNNIGLSQMNGAHNEYGNIGNNFHNGSDLNRLSQAALMQQQLMQQNVQNAEHVMNSSLFGTNMSKFFDFHKNQQQQQMHQFLVNNHTSGGGLGSNQINEHLRIASMMENNRLNSQFMDQGNGLLTSQHQQQQQIQKQRLLGNTQPQSSSTQAPQTNSQQQQQSNRLVNQYAQNASVDDDLGFDPFIETQKALAELMENEVVQQQNLGPTAGGNMLQQQQQQQQQHQQQLMDNMQRARMPPPGFNHMNAFGFGVPRAQSTSKILPFMNVASNQGNNAALPTAPNGQLTQQQQLPMSNAWNPHMAVFQQQQLNEPPSGQNPKGYSNNDWTAMDPAILSFRQFSSFPQQSQMPHHTQQQQQQQQDLFMQHLNQQPNQGFGSQSSQPLHNGVNLPNALLNAQQTSQTQANFSHSNWLNTEQTLFMNSLANGFAGNANHNINFDKFTVPMPPGMHPSNLNKPQKTECIN